MIYYDKDGIIARDAKESDIKAIAENMRQEDRRELEATGFTPEWSLCHGYTHSRFLVTLEHNGQPVAMFGYVPDSLLSERAIVWMLTTDGIDKIKKTFLRLSRRFVRLMLSHYGELYNYVDARYEKSVSWLRWCGAEILAPVKIGLNDEYFYPFILRRS